jgi:hypothetical protein
MSVATEKIARAIQKLPMEQMLMMHEDLIAVIHDKAESQGLDPEFRKEIEQRIKDIDAGKAKGADAIRALRKM